MLQKQKGLKTGIDTIECLLTYKQGLDVSLKSSKTITGKVIKMNAPSVGRTAVAA